MRATKPIPKTETAAIKLLNYLKKRGELPSQKEVARQLYFSQSTISRALNYLLREGHIKKIIIFKEGAWKEEDLKEQSQNQNMDKK